MTKERCIVAGENALFSALLKAIGPGGPELTPASDADAALRMLCDDGAVMLVLEDRLGGARGTDLLKRIRADARTSRKPVIFVSGSDSEIDRVLAFELGADDFVPKPYSPRELALRMVAVLRRSRQPSLHRASYQIAIGPVRIDFVTHQVEVSGENVPLTALEFRLLSDLARHRGQVRSRDQLLRSVWNHPSSLDTRTVDTHIKRLREKLGTAAGWIETVRGVGYRSRKTS